MQHSHVIKFRSINEKPGSQLQALGFQIPWITVFQFRAQRSWETIGNNFLVPWKPTFSSFNVQKHVIIHTFKLNNISVYYYLQKNKNKMSEEGQFK